MVNSMVSVSVETLVALAFVGGVALAALVALACWAVAASSRAFALECRAVALEARLESAKADAALRFTKYLAK